MTHTLMNHPADGTLGWQFIAVPRFELRLDSLHYSLVFSASSSGVENSPYIVGTKFTPFGMLVQMSLPRGKGWRGDGGIMEGCLGAN